MELGPDDAGYDKFCLFRGEWSPYATSYNSWGDLTTAIVPTDTVYDIYIATCVIGGDTSQTTLCMYKLTLYRHLDVTCCWCLIVGISSLELYSRLFLFFGFLLISLSDLDYDM